MSIHATILGPARTLNAVRTYKEGTVEASPNGGVEVRLEDGRAMRIVLDDELATAELALDLLGRVLAKRSHTDLLAAQKSIARWLQRNNRKETT